MAFGSPSGVINLPNIDIVIKGAKTPAELDSLVANLLVVSRDPGQTGAISVDYAISGIDVDQATGTIVWAENENTTKPIPVTLEGIGYGTVTLSNPSRTDGGTELPTIGIGYANVTYIPVLISGDSWSGFHRDNPEQGNPAQTVNSYGEVIAFYEDYLSSDIDLVANEARGGRGIWGNSYWGAQYSLEELFHEELANHPLAKIVLLITGGANDFAHQPFSSFDLQNWQDAVIRVSDKVVQAGAQPVWGNVPLVDGISKRNGWLPEHSEFVFEYNSWLESYCLSNGFAYIDLHSEFVLDGSLNPLYRLHSEAPRWTHLNVAGHQHLSVLVKNAIDSLVADAQADLSLTASSYVLEEGQTSEVSVVRSGDLSGTARALYLLAPGSADNLEWVWGWVNWNDGEGGLKTAPITIGPVASNTEATIYLALQSGSAGTPDLGTNISTLSIIDISSDLNY